MGDRAAVTRSKSESALPSFSYCLANNHGSQLERGAQRAKGREFAHCRRGLSEFRNRASEFPAAKGSGWFGEKLDVLESGVPVHVSSLRRYSI